MLLLWLFVFPAVFAKLELYNKWSAINVRDQPVTVYCKYVYAKYNEYSPPSYRTLKWTPVENHRGDKSFQQFNYVKTQQSPYRGNNYPVYMYSRLTINPADLDENDEREYSCQLYGERQTLEEEAKFRLTLFDPTDPLNITDFEPAVNVRVNEDAIWTINVESVSPVYIEQIVRNVHEILPHEATCTPTNMSVETVSTSWQCSVILRNVNDSMEAEHEFALYNNGSTEKIVLYHWLHPRAELSIDGISSALSIGSPAEPRCLAKGFTPGEKEQWKNSNPIGYYIDPIVSEETPLDGVFIEENELVVAQFHFTPNNSGTFVCKAEETDYTNEKRILNVNKTVNVKCISDAPDSLLNIQQEEVTYVLSCKISHCNYNKTHGIRWKYESPPRYNRYSEYDSKRESYWLDDDDAEISTGMFSTRSILRLKKPTPGNYICIADPLSSSYVSQRSFTIQ